MIAVCGVYSAQSIVYNTQYAHMVYILICLVCVSDSIFIVLFELQWMLD